MITTANYYDSTKNIDWNAVPSSLKKTHETLIPDAAKGDWKTYYADEDVRRVVEKYFGYIGKYIAPSVATTTKSANLTTKSKANKSAPDVSERTGEKQAREVAAALIRPYVLRGDTLDSIRKSWLGSSGNGGSAQVKGNKIFVDKVGGDAVNFSFSLLTLFNEIKGPKNEDTLQKKQGKKGKMKDVSSLPEPTQVVFIPTATAFIKRYATLHGKVKSRDQILSLTHGLQKAITEQRIKTGSPAIREIEKMQKELIALATTMGESVKIEIDAPSLAHYKQIAQGEEVRSSVKLLKSFIAMTGKAYDKTKAASLLKRMEAASDIIPKEDAYRTQLITAIEELSVYVQGKEKTVGIPSAGLHGLGAIAAGHGVHGLGIITPGSGEGAIIRLLRAEGVKSLSDAALKKGFRGTVVPGLCLEIARSLIRRGELSMAILNEPPKKKSYWEGGGGLRGLGDANVAESSGRITDLDILEMRLAKSVHQANSLSGLGNVETAALPSAATANRSIIEASAIATPTETVSARELARMHFNTIGYKGRFQDVVGDPALGFHMMVFGKPYSGKSSFVIEFCKDLAALHKGKIAYLALEEGISLSMQKKVIDRGADKVDGLEFKGSMPSSFEGYAFIVIDSVSDRSMSRESLRELFLNNPKTCFICIFHATKAGSARGGLDYSHDMDIIIKIEGHKPVVEKNRFL